MTTDPASEIASRVPTSLGSKGGSKEWLAGCLLKTISGNQRGESRVPELMDCFPEVISWLKEEHDAGS